MDFVRVVKMLWDSGMIMKMKDSGDGSDMVMNMIKEMI